MVRAACQAGQAPTRPRCGSWKTKPTAKGIVTSGKIADWAYYGDTSHMYVETRDNLRIAVTVQNENRSTVESVDVGDTVWLNWRAEDTLPLTE